MDETTKAAKPRGCPRCHRTDRIYSIESMYVLVRCGFDEDGQTVYDPDYDQIDIPESMEQVDGPDRYRCRACDHEFEEPIEVPRETTDDDNDEDESIKAWDAETEELRRPLLLPENPTPPRPAPRWTSADEILRAMDPRMFAQQRETLINISAKAKEHAIGPCYESDIEGLLNLLDELADYTTDTLGMDCTIHAEDGEKGKAEDRTDPRD